MKERPILFSAPMVRVERLNDITESDALAEGIRAVPGRDVPAAMGGNVRTYGYSGTEEWFTSPQSAYRSLWRSINGAESVAANPWVWVIEFKRVAP